MDDGHATAEGSGDYGYGRTVLGVLTLFQRVYERRAQANVYPFWYRTSDRGTTDSYMSAERLYLSSAYPQGHSMSPRVYTSRGFGLTAPGLYQNYGSPYPVLYENTTSYATVATEVSIHDPSSAYPGRWWFYLKSIKLHKQSNGAYYFEGANILPQDPDRGGYDPNG